MKSLIATTLLAVNAAAVNMTQPTVSASAEVVVVNEEYYETFNVLEDAEIAVAMQQGTGRDHTDWSWHFESEQAKEETRKTADDVIGAEGGLAGAKDEYDAVLH